MKFDPLRHHRQSIRIKEFDYSQPGGYVVTIVSHQRECLFGEIVNQEIKLSRLGLIVKQQWEKLPRRFPYVELGAFVIMPNHVHGIIIIHDRRGTAEDSKDLGAGAFRRAPTEEFGEPISGSIPTIVRSYKSAVAYRSHLMPGKRESPVWQRNYYEHIVRDEKDWDRINRYIQSNPGMWAEDHENPLNK